MDLKGLAELQIKCITLMYDLRSSFYLKVYTSHLPDMVSMHAIKCSIMSAEHWQPLCDDLASAYVLSPFDSAHWYSPLHCVIYNLSTD